MNFKITFNRKDRMSRAAQKKEYDPLGEIYEIFGKDIGGIIWSYARPLTMEEINFKDMLDELLKHFIPSCDGCCKGWGIENEVGLCQCWCGNCHREMAICQNNCYKDDYVDLTDDEFKNMCDYCCKSWIIEDDDEDEDEVGLCRCWCDNCGRQMADCRDNCYKDE
jgi:hypothetical protein